jgi:Ca2+-binding RTX toxin-like protein
VITLARGNAFQFHLFNGGNGIDTLDLSQMTAPVNADLGLGTLSGAQTGFAALIGIENVVGGSGGDRLTGSAGANLIEGGAGNDRLTGRGGADTFVFGAGSGADVVTDFAAGAGAGDVLRLKLGAAFDSFADVMAAAAQSGVNTVITFDALNRVTLLGVSKAALAADDFAFG